MMTATKTRILSDECMRVPGVCQRRSRRAATRLAASAAVLLLAGCADLIGPSSNVTVSDPLRITRTGFLSDYNRLAPAPGADGAMCWRQSNLDMKRYSKVMITRIVVSLKSDQQEAVDPSDLKALVDYFHNALVKSLKPQLQVVDQAGPGVIVLRIALTNLVPTQVSRSLAGTAIPYGFVAEAAFLAAQRVQRELQNKIQAAQHELQIARDQIRRLQM